MDIENTIKVLLNGCVKHSGIEEIKSKLKKINSDNRPLIIKLGLAPSAPDIHIGHAVVLRKIRQLQELGHEWYRDQIFNVLMGRNIQRYFGQEPQLTFFLPLLEGTDGIEKMSKSLGNYVGISEEPPSIYTKIMKIPDNMIIKYYELCTDVHPDKISEIKKELKAKNPRDVKMSLAKEITTLYCGKDNAEDAEKYFKSVFWKQETPNNATKIEIPKNSSNFIFDFINVITETGDFKSKSEIKRLFEQRSVKINGSVITDIQSISELHGEATLQIGKSHIYKLYK